MERQFLLRKNVMEKGMKIVAVLAAVAATMVWFRGAEAAEARIAEFVFSCLGSHYARPDNEPAEETVNPGILPWYKENPTHPG